MTSIVLPAMYWIVIQAAWNFRRLKYQLIWKLPFRASVCYQREISDFSICERPGSGSVFSVSINVFGFYQRFLCHYFANEIHLLPSPPPPLLFLLLLLLHLFTHSSSLFTPPPPSSSLLLLLHSSYSSLLLLFRPHGITYSLIYNNF